MAGNGSKRGKIACLLASDFEDSELQVPMERLQAAGYEVEIVGSKAGEKLEGKRKKVTVKAHVGIDDAQIPNYEGLLIPGGYSPDHLRADKRFVDFVAAFDVTGRPMAAVCHGPQLLLSAQLVRGRTLTAWPTIQGDLRQAGAEVRDEPVVVDGNWITSRMPADLEAFSAKLLEELAELEDRGRWPHATIDPQMV
jgi:protease I